MDYIYGYFNNNASAKTQIKDYFNEYISSMQSSGYVLSPSNTSDENTFEMMGVALGEEERSMLVNYCSVDNLTVDGEMPKLVNSRKLRQKEIFDPGEPADANLQTLEFLKRRLKMKGKDINLKYKSELIISHKKLDPSGELLLPGEDILVLVRLYSPFMNHLKHEAKPLIGSRLSLSTVIGILGSQTLADLREKISCIMDYSISKECSNNLQLSNQPMAKDVYKSGFFFIEDTFYNDTRDPTNVDYSKVIIDWAKRRSKLGPFRVDSMENCRIDSLCVRFGFPWVYRHQGNCEHLICFSNARLIDSDDELVQSGFPRIVRVKPKHSRLCLICGVFSAFWVTVEHDRIPHNPCFFCDTCFKSFNYINGKKVGNFLAYPYPRNIERVKGIIKM